MNSELESSRSSEDDPFWYKDTIIYQLHVKAYFDSNGDGTGDFRGLTSKLDYLKELGVGALWLLPFSPSPFKDDGYDIADYRNIHPNYGTLQDFKTFLKEAHARGLKVITELVINHTSDQHPWFQAARRAKPGSKKREMYVWSDTDQKFQETRIIFCDTETSNWAWDNVANAYYWHRFYSHQPDLNLNNPAVVKEVGKILAFWLEMGVDGLRLDAVPYLCVKEGTNNENLPETHAVLKELRRVVDKNFSNRMLLAEANQWPDDVRPYFGDGDECHMAFHFPLMPRIYIALRKETRDPIVDIMERTPKIPESCQWGLFLRNHDELTLEMVTDEERDFMYREYAADPRMRINLGIRRRLAPLVGNSFRRLELLNSILFSFPGTPIIYYGDEIGMGDNIYLGDRNGVRTPMQWTPDRNAGFSAADPARLYFPVIMDPVYGYQRVNVEAQERDPGSLLNFMKRLIALRRQYKAFGRGTLEFLHPRNKKVLAYFRIYREEVILCVVNMSRFPQPVELDLRRYEGWMPMEMFGRTEFPRIGELPYLLTLGPHAFYWFRLERESRPLPLPAPDGIDIVEPPVLMMESFDDEVFDNPNLVQQFQDIIHSSIRRKRWFQGKSKPIAQLKVKDTAKLGAHLFLVTVQVIYESTGEELYSIPVRLVSGRSAEKIAECIPQSVLAIIRTPNEKGVLVDALGDQSACQLLLEAMYNERKFPTSGEKTVFARSTPLLDSTIKKEEHAFLIEPLGAEQTNTSIVYGKQFILKLFRKLERGVNPQLEISHFLSEKTTFRNAPQLAGWLTMKDSDGTETTLGVLEKYLENNGDGWNLTLSHLREAFRQMAEHDTGSLRHRKLNLAVIAKEQPEVTSEIVSKQFLPVIAQLARRTAELHLALGSSTQIRAFSPVPLDSQYIDSIFIPLQTRLGKIPDMIKVALPHLSPSTNERAQRAFDAANAATEYARNLEAKLRETAKTKRISRIRCHGDYHLGQVLRVEDDFFIVDFEGEPLLPISERTQKHSPFKDVAGMLRSFQYAAFRVLLDLWKEHPEWEASKRAQLERLAESWGAAAGEHFLKVYFSIIQTDKRLSPDAETAQILLQTFMLDKVLYELEYELNNRPDWVDIPLLGFLNAVQ